MDIPEQHQDLINRMIGKMELPDSFQELYEDMRRMLDRVDMRLRPQDLALCLRLAGVRIVPPKPQEHKAEVVEPLSADSAPPAPKRRGRPPKPVLSG